jgi:protein-S-isoprenylcysteine O-methyltransferase Ste14
MLKKLYVLAWFLLIGSAAVSVFNGSLNEVGMLAFGLIGLALVHALALWAVFTNPGEMHPE